MFLIYSRENAEPPPHEELESMESLRWSVLWGAKQQGMLVAADWLKSTDTATTVRATEGPALIVDGPFDETAEQLVGYYILECSDLDAAIEWAERMQSSNVKQNSCIEIRPVARKRRWS